VTNKQFSVSGRARRRRIGRSATKIESSAVDLSPEKDLQHRLEVLRLLPLVTTSLAGGRARRSGSTTNQIFRCQSFSREKSPTPPGGPRACYRQRGKVSNGGSSLSTIAGTASTVWQLPHRVSPFLLEGEYANVTERGDLRLRPRMGRAPLSLPSGFRGGVPVTAQEDVRPIRQGAPSP